MRSWSDLRIGRRPWVIAHRGDSAHFPENTMAAFDGAITAGADAIELDVRLAADDAAVVIHDERLDRTTSASGRVDDRDGADVAALDAGSWFAPGFAGEGVPTLDRVLDRFGGRIALNLELKANGEGADASRLVAAVARQVASDGNAHGVLLSSFEPAVLEAARLHLPDRTRVLLAEGRLDAEAIVSTARRLGAAGVGLDAESATASVLGFFHDAGLPVLLFTVDEEAEMRALLRTGADGIFSNRPARLRGVVEGTT